MSMLARTNHVADDVTGRYSALVHMGLQFSSEYCITDKAGVTAERKRGGMSTISTENN